MKKSQLSLFIIIGFILLIFVGFFIFTLSGKGQNQFEFNQKKALTELAMKTDVEKTITSCIKYSTEETMSETGIRQETIGQYEQLLESQIKSCTLPILTRIKEQGYNVYEGEISVEAEINPDTIIVDINYPLKIEKDSQKIEFNEFHYSFERSNTIRVPNGITDREIRLVSSNGKAELKIPQGVKITDEEGNPVENIGIKVLDLHFDGLDNNVIIGQLVYENFPDKTTFSEPIELSIEFDEKDIPEGYTRENLRIAFWDEEDGMWYAPPTEIKDNLAIANITHFSEWAISAGSPTLIQTIIFKQRFQPFHGSPEGGNTGVWNITGKEGSPLGKVILQYGYSTIYDVIAEYSRENTPVQYIDFKEQREKRKGDFISYSALNYGYFNNEEFIDCENYNSNNLGGLDYYLGSDGYPWIRDAETGVSEFGWHNLQCAGGTIRPAKDENKVEKEEASDFIVFQPNGNSVLAIFDSITSTPIIFPYVYPLEDTVSSHYSLKYLIENSDAKYPFYCRIAPFSDGEEFKKISLSPESISELEKRGLDTSKKYVTYGVYGVDSIKRIDHPLTRYEMHAQCEIFWFLWGNGIAYKNIPQQDIYQGLDINIPMEIGGMLALREWWDIETWKNLIPEKKK